MINRAVKIQWFGIYAKIFGQEWEICPLCCMQKWMNDPVQTSIDHFLGSKLRIEQPLKGYRAGIDAVLLSAAAAAIGGKNIAELGCGVGTALLSTFIRLNGDIKSATGFEIDEAAAKLCLQNADANGFADLVKVHNIDGLIPNKDFEYKADLVLSNPPFFDDDSAIRNPMDEKTKAYIIGAPLLAWIKAMLRLCQGKGQIVIIHRADRLYDIIHALQNRAGDVRILPIHGVMGRPANRIIIRAKKGSKAPLQILPPLILRAHEQDRAYLPQIDDICNGISTNVFDGLK